MKRIVLFDGACHFCNASVQFIIARDPSGYFHFSPLQSETGQRFMQQFNIPEDADSIVLIEHNQAYTKSTAALRIAKKLDGLWHLLFIGIRIPRPIRDSVYRYIANNRYKWFGKEDDACVLPPPEVRNRFL